MKYCTLALLGTAMLLVGCELPDPQQRLAAMHLPPPGFTGDPATGRKLYANACQQCHGLDASGTAQGPSLVDRIYQEKHHADLAFHFAVRDGVRQHHWNFGDMPKMPHITPEQTEHVIAYLRGKQSSGGR